MSGSGISWAICKSAHRSRQITTPAPYHSVFLHARCPSWRPTDSVKALKFFDVSERDSLPTFQSRKNHNLPPNMDGEDLFFGYKRKIGWINSRQKFLCSIDDIDKAFVFVLWSSVIKRVLAALGHIHRFNGPLSGTTQVSQYQKGKTNLDFSEARDSEWQWNQLGRMQVCISLQTNNHASTPPLGFLQAGCPSCHPTNSVKALAALGH